MTTKRKGRNRVLASMLAVSLALMAMPAAAFATAAPEPHLPAGEASDLPVSDNAAQNSSDESVSDQLEKTLLRGDQQSARANPPDTDLDSSNDSVNPEASGDTLAQNQASTPQASSRSTAAPGPKASTDATWDESTKTLTVHTNNGSEQSTWTGSAVGGKADTIERVVVEEGVTLIAEGGFMDCSTLTSVTLPSSLTTIGKQAFEKCSKLTSINLPSSLTAIGDAAFYMCSTLASVNPPSSLTTIGAEAFEYCSTLASINLPSSLTAIGGYAFAHCALTEVEVPAGVTSLNGGVFAGNNLTRVSLPEGLTSIGNNAFSSNKALTEITIPSTVNSIGLEAFNKCEKLTKVVVKNPTPGGLGLNAFMSLPAGFRIYVPLGTADVYKATPGWITYKDNIFEHSYEWDAAEGALTIVSDKGSTSWQSDSAITADAVQTIFVLDTVTDIAANAFSGCTNVENVVISEGVKTIGSSAFEGCTTLASVNIPASITSIGAKAFKGCAALSLILVNAETPATLGTDAFDGLPTDFRMNVVSGLVSAYKTAWLAYAQHIFAHNPVVYAVSFVGDSTWTVGSKAAFSVKWDAHKLEFIGASLDSDKIDPANFEVSAGSTILTLKPAYLDSLSEGLHTLVVESWTGVGETTFTVKKAGPSPGPNPGPNPDPTPKPVPAKKLAATGDATAPFVTLAFGSMLIALIVGGAALARRRQK